MAELLRRGLIAAKAPEGVPNFDIVITDINGERLAAIQVKTPRDYRVAPAKPPRPLSILKF
jgi:hypothetical protein